MNKSPFGIGIPLFHAPWATQKSLRYLLAHHPEPIVCVVNDGFAFVWEQRLKDWGLRDYVILVENTENNLYRAWNIIATVFRKCPYVLIASNDVLIPPETLNAFRKIAAEGSYDLACARQYFEKGRTNVSNDCMSAKQFMRERPLGEDIWGEMHFACFLLKISRWQELGGFDERFKVYCGDLDFQYRLSVAGGVFGTFSACPVFHFGKDIFSSESSRNLDVEELCDIIAKDSETLYNIYKGSRKSFCETVQRHSRVDLQRLFRMFSRPNGFELFRNSELSHYLSSRVL